VLLLGLLDLAGRDVSAPWYQRCLSTLSFLLHDFYTKRP
jgi:hypothetical protein